MHQQYNQDTYKILLMVDFHLTAQLFTFYDRTTRYYHALFEKISGITHVVINCCLIKHIQLTDYNNVKRESARQKKDNTIFLLSAYTRNR